MNDIVNYERISEDPQNFKDVFTRQISLADDVRTGKVDVNQGDVEAKALYGATKSLDVDIRARILSDRQQHRTPLPHVSERSGHKSLDKPKNK